MAKLLVLFHSFYGHTYRLAEAVAEGAREATADVTLKQVPEHIAAEALQASGAAKAKEGFAHVPVATIDELTSYDGIAFGTGTRFGNMSSTMRNFLDQTGRLWAEGKLIGKVATVFCSTGTGGGRETTIVSTWITLAHLGMILVPIGYGAPGIRDTSEVHGGSPYGAGTVQRAAAPRPSSLELGIARYQGKVWAQAAVRQRA